MTIPPFFRRPVRYGTVFSFVASLAFLAAGPRASADDNLSESLQHNEKDEQQIQAQAREFAAQLKAMSSEFERNGLTGDSVKMLDVLSEALGTMSEQEMAKIIGLLRDARTLNDKTAVLQQVAAAYAGQKRLTVDMKGLLARYQKDQVTADVAATLAKLAERQSANFQAGVDVAQWTETKKSHDKNAENSEDALRAAVEMQSAEQAALRDEAKMATDRLQKAAADKSDPAATARAQVALDKLKAVDSQLEQAAQDLKDNHLFKAVGNEKAARDAMRQLARELTPIKPNDADSLRQASHDVDEMIAQQKEMIAQTEKANQPIPTDFEAWLKQALADPKSDAHGRLAKILEHAETKDGNTFEALKDDKKVKAAFDQNAKQATHLANQALGALESKANDLLNKADDVNQNLQANATDAAATVKAAQDKIQAVRADLDDHNAAPALQNQQAALAQMQAAQKQIQAKLAAEESGLNPDRIAALQAIKQQGKELAAQQNVASQQQAAQPQNAPSNAAQQAEMKKKAQDLQSKSATAQSPAAAAAFQNAANQMSQAADALSKPNGQPQAQAAENAAQAELAKADAALAKDINQADATKQELQQAELALAALEKIITGQEKVQSDTTGLTAKAPAPETKDAKPSQPAPHAANPAELAGQQATLKGGTAAVVAMLTTPDLQPAAAPLNAAQDQMESSRAALARTDAMAALAPEREAMTDLLQAKALAQLQEGRARTTFQPAGSRPTGPTGRADRRPGHRAGAAASAAGSAAVGPIIAERVIAECLVAKQFGPE